MPRSGPKQYNCILCSKRTKPKERRKVTKQQCKFLKKTFFTDPTEDDVLCNKCAHKYYDSNSRPTATQSNGDEDDYVTTKRIRIEETPSSPPSVTLSIPTTSKSHAYCFICKRPRPKLVVVSPEARFSVLLNNNILIPAGCRCCPVHSDDGTILPESLKGLKTMDTTLVNRTTIYEIVQKLRDAARKSASLRIDFDNADMLTETDYCNLTGVSKANFSDICEHVKAYIRNTPARSTRTSVAIFMLKLKSGMSNKLLSTIFNITKSSIRRAISSVRQALMITFVPNYLGLQHISRETVINQHTRPLAQSIFGNVG